MAKIIDLQRPDLKVILTETSTTVVTLEGGLDQITPTSLTVDTAVSGFGGLDTGSLANDTIYYLYIVYSTLVPGLVMSLSSSTPTGFTDYMKIGILSTNSTGDISVEPLFGQSTFINGIAGLGATDTNVVKFSTTIQRQTGSGLYNLDTTTALGTRVIILKNNLRIAMHAAAGFNTNTYQNITLNGITYGATTAMDFNYSVTTTASGVNAVGILKKDDILRFVRSANNPSGTGTLTIEASDLQGINNNRIRHW